MTDYKEYAKQMRENAVKNEQGNIVCSPELWEEIADIIERAIIPPCKVGQTVYYLARNIHTHIEKVTSGKVVRIAITESGIDLFVNNYVAKLPYGKRSFLTKEEAEEKLKECE